MHILTNGHTPPHQRRSCRYTNSANMQSTVAQTQLVGMKPGYLPDTHETHWLLYLEETQMGSKH